MRIIDVAEKQQLICKSGILEYFESREDVTDIGGLEILKDWLANRALAFTDKEIPLRIDGVDTGECMWAPKLEARIVPELAIRPHDTVLEIGTGSGYLSALLAHKAHHVLSISVW